MLYHWYMVLQSIRSNKSRNLCNIFLSFICNFPPYLIFVADAANIVHGEILDWRFGSVEMWRCEDVEMFCCNLRCFVVIYAVLMWRKIEEFFVRGEWITKNIVYVDHFLFLFHFLGWYHGSIWVSVLSSILIQITQKKSIFLRSWSLQHQVHRAAVARRKAVAAATTTRRQENILRATTENILRAITENIQPATTKTFSTITRSKEVRGEIHLKALTNEN